MIRVLSSLNYYTINTTLESETEDFESYTLIYKLSDIAKSLEWDVLKNSLSNVNTRDSVTLTITLDNMDPYMFLLSNTDNNLQYEKDIENINDLIDDDSILTIKYTISKNKKDKKLSIYNFSLFCQFLHNQKLVYLLNHLKKNIDFNEYLHLEVQNDPIPKIYFNSNIIYCASASYSSNFSPWVDQSERKKILDIRKFNANPQIFSEYKFIPEDFHNVSSDQNMLDTLLHKVHIVLCASYIANASNIVKTDNLQFGFIGHKFIDVICNFTTNQFNDCRVFSDIYQWIYSKDDIHDKLDLSRNIISRYIIRQNGTISLPEDTYNSIQSAHAIYLKENVEKYIETKNKVAEVATELSIKSTEISQFFIAGFKNNNLTVLTFFTSIFIFNSLSDNFLKNLFTGQIYYLSLVFLLISVIYLFIIRCQLMNDLKKNIVYFYRIKRIYRDLFDKKELNNLFNYRHLRDTKKYVLNTVRRYTFLWLIEVLILLITIISFNLFL